MRAEGAEVEGSEKVDVDCVLPEVSVFGRDDFKDHIGQFVALEKSIEIVCVSSGSDVFRSNVNSQKKTKSSVTYRLVEARDQCVQECQSTPPPDPSPIGRLTPFPPELEFPKVNTVR